MGPKPLSAHPKRAIIRPLGERAFVTSLKAPSCPVRVHPWDRTVPQEDGKGRFWGKAGRQSGDDCSNNFSKIQPPLSRRASLRRRDWPDGPISRAAVTAIYCPRKQAADELSCKTDTTLRPTMEHCSGCGTAITDRYILRIRSDSWHESCAVCCICGSSFDESCFVKEEKLYCRYDYSK